MLHEAFEGEGHTSFDKHLEYDTDENGNVISFSIVSKRHGRERKQLGERWKGYNMFWDAMLDPKNIAHFEQTGEMNPICYVQWN